MVSLIITAGPKKGLWIRIGFKADPNTELDPAIYLDADYLPGLLVNFGQFPCSWIRIRIPNTDPDLGQQAECRSTRIYTDPDPQN
jgi:hypothetical protein